jgi:hypothetical protein
MSVRQLMQQAHGIFENHPGSVEGRRLIVRAARVILDDPQHRDACDPMLALVNYANDGRFNDLSLFRIPEEEQREIRRLESSLRLYCRRIPQMLLDRGRQQFADYRQGHDVNELTNGAIAVIESEIPDVVSCEMHAALLAESATVAAQRPNSTHYAFLVTLASALQPLCGEYRSAAARRVTPSP